MTRLINRGTAGKALFPLVTKALKDEFDQIPQGVVMALPRGGIQVGLPIAKGLKWPLTLCLVRKLGVPGQPELAFGAIAASDIKVIHSGLIKQLHLGEKQLQRVIDAEQAELERRQRCYDPPPPPEPLENYVVLLVDDGIATGATMEAAIVWAQSQNPRQVWVAVPVAPPEMVDYFQGLVDRVICPNQPKVFRSLGCWYEDFRQVSDQQVIDCLHHG